MLVSIFVYVLHRFSASTLSIVALAGTVSALVGMPFAGAFADRHNVRMLAIGSMAVQTLAVLGVLATLHDEPWGIAACDLPGVLGEQGKRSVTY